MWNKIIAVDIDEVLSETLKSMFKKNNSQLNWKHINWEDITQYDLWNIEKFWITKKQAIFMFAKHQLWSWLFNKIEPVQWAKKKILDLKEKWYKLAIISNLSKEYEEPLRNLIPEWLIDYESLSFKVWEIKPNSKIFEKFWQPTSL